MGKQEIQERYMQLQMLDQQIKNAKSQVEALEQQLLELNTVMLALEDFSKLQKGTTMYVPITSGIFAKAKLEDTEEFTVNVGADVAVKKNMAETKKLVAKQVEEITQVQQQTMIETQELINQAKQLQKLLKSMIEASES